MENQNITKIEVDEESPAADAVPIRRSRGSPKKPEVPAVAKQPRGRPRIWFGDERPKYRPKDPEYAKKYYMNVVKPKSTNSKNENLIIETSWKN